MRAVLEGMAAGAAADLATQAHVDRLLCADRMFEQAVEDLTGEPRQRGRGHEGARWQMANDEFHEAIHDAAHNRVLAATIRSLHRRFPRNLTWSALGELLSTRLGVLVE